MTFAKLTLLLCCASMPAMAQQTSTERPHVELALTYNATRIDLTPGSSFWTQGGAVELAAPLIRHLSVVADVTALTTSSGGSSGVPLGIVSTTFGPRFTFTMPRMGKRRITVFGQGLVGEAHGLNSVFPGDLGATSDALSLAAQVGGGVDMRLKRHFGIRIIQADWLRTQFPNGRTNIQNNLRLGSGITFHF